MVLRFWIYVFYSEFEKKNPQYLSWIFTLGQYSFTFLKKKKSPAALMIFVRHHLDQLKFERKKNQWKFDFKKKSRLKLHWIIFRTGENIDFRYLLKTVAYHIYLKVIFSIGTMFLAEHTRSIRLIFKKFPSELKELPIYSIKSPSLGP